MSEFGGSSTHINSNMSRPYSEEVSAGYERQIWSDLRLGVTYYYRTKKNLIGIENSAVSKSDYVPVTGFINPINNQPLTLYSFQPSDPSLYSAFNYMLRTFRC